MSRASTHHPHRAAHRRQLNVQLGGAARGGEPIVFLHGFPESHRTWRDGRARSRPRFPRGRARPARLRRARTSPRASRHYRTDRILEDLIALADALGARPLHPGRPRLGRRGRLAGGAAGIPTGSRGSSSSTRRIRYVFQKSLIEDAAQRAASQYISAFRNPAMEQGIEAMGFETFFDKTFGSHADLGLDPGGGAAGLSRRLGAARRADRDAELVPGERDRRCRSPARRPTRRPGPSSPSRSLAVPTLVIWALQGQGAAAGPARRPARPGRRPPDRHRRRRRPFRPLGAARAGDRRDPGFHGATRLSYGARHGHHPQTLALPLRRPARRRAGALPAGDGGDAGRGPAPRIPPSPARRDHRRRRICRGRGRFLRRSGDAAPTPAATSSTR